VKLKTQISNLKFEIPTWESFQAESTRASDEHGSVDASMCKIFKIRPDGNCRSYKIEPKGAVKEAVGLVSKSS